MNKILMPLLFGAFILTVPGFAQTPPPAPDAAAPAAATATTPQATTPKAAARHDRFPEFHKAMRKLRSAKQDLLKLTHEYNGHKAKAVEDIDQALTELRAAIALEANKTTK